MTGYAMVRRDTSAGELSVSLRSVNHRGLDLNFYQPPELAAYESAIRAILKQNIARGHVEVRISLHRRPAAASGYEPLAVGDYVALFRERCGGVCPEAKRYLTVLSALPSVLETST